MDASERRYGFQFPFRGVPLHASGEALAGLVRAGYTDAWTAESNGFDAATPLAMAAAWEPTLRVGTSIVPVFSRGPALLAMTAAALADIAPGRFTLGLGASTATVIEDWNAVPYERPYGRVRDTVRFLRQALAGERVEEEYETFSVKGFRLENPPATVPPIMLAALRPQMLRLAATRADGIIVNWLAAGDLERVIGEVGTAREIVTKITVCVEPTKDFLPGARRLVAAYLSAGGYAAYQRWLGREQALAPMWEAWAAGERREAMDAIPDSVLEELFVFGSREECRAGIARFVDAGTTVPVICCLRGGLDPVTTFELLAP